MLIIRNSPLSWRPVDFKKVPWCPVDFKKVLCRMSLMPKKGHGAVSIFRGLHPHNGPMGQYDDLGKYCGPQTVSKVFILVILQ